MKSIKEILRIVAAWDIYKYFYWDEDIRCYIICNDLFWYGGKGREEVTEKNLGELVAALQDVGRDEGCQLFVCRQRNMRPSGRYYKYLSEENWYLFDECGPTRKLEFGNCELHPLEYDLNE